MRLAILPANVLLADNSSQWLAVAIPLVLSQDLATAKLVIPLVAGSESAVYQLGATESLRVTVEERAKRLSIEGAMRDVPTQRNRRLVPPGEGDLLTELNALAKEIDGYATVFSTHNPRALEAFAIGVSSPNAQLKTQRLRDAIAADPSFGLAYVVLAESLANANSPDAAAVLQDGEAHLASFTELDRARFNFLRSKILHATLEQQGKAGADLVKLSPNDAEALAALGSNMFLQGKATEGERLMDRAITINPESAEIRQQLATGLIESKQFGKAEKVLASLAANPAIQPQLAFCILFEGDAARAAIVFEKFVSSVANPDAQTFLRASWQALAGHRPEAIQALTEAHFTDQRFLTLAKNQEVLWQVMDKRYREAKVASVGAGQIAALLASGAASPEEWNSKVAAIADKRSQANLRAYGLFLYGFYAPAAAAWKELDANAGNADLRARTMLAASLKLAGKADEASKIPVQPFIPDFSDYFNPVTFAQLRSLLGQAE